jgi:hypothetical protein
MIQPSTSTRVDVGLVLPHLATTERLESAQKFNALFTHRVRITAPAEVNDEFAAWLHAAYQRAGDEMARAPATAKISE